MHALQHVTFLVSVHPSACGACAVTIVVYAQPTTEISKDSKIHLGHAD